MVFSLGRIGEIARSLIRVVAIAGPAGYQIAKNNNWGDRINGISRTYGAYNLATNQFEPQHLQFGIIPKGFMPEILVEIGFSLAAAAKSLIKSVF